MAKSGSLKVIGLGDDPPRVLQEGQAMLRQRQPRVRDKKYLAYIGEIGREYGCVLCHRPAEVAHVRFAECLHEQGSSSPEWRFGKLPTGMGSKSDDKWTVPLCPDCHRLGKHSQHSMNERQWWADKGIDVLALCHELQQAYPSVEDGVAVLEGLTTPLEERMV